MKYTAIVALIGTAFASKQSISLARQEQIYLKNSMESHLHIMDVAEQRKVGPILEAIEQRKTDLVNIVKMQKEFENKGFTNLVDVKKPVQSELSQLVRYVDALEKNDFNMMIQDISLGTQFLLQQNELIANKLAQAQGFMNLQEEPAAEPAAEPVAEPAAEPAAEPVAEPAAEPAAKPAAEVAEAKPEAEVSVTKSDEQVKDTTKVDPVPETNVSVDASVVDTNAAEPVPVEKGSNTMMIILIIAVIAGGVGAFLFIRNKKKAQSESEGGERDSKKLFKNVFSRKQHKRETKEVLVPTFVVPAEETI